MWKKVSPDGSPAFLAVGANVMSDRDRITVQLNHHGEKRGSTLLIGLANDNDAGHYVCQLGTNEDNKELKHTVLVRYHSHNTIYFTFELLPFGQFLFHQGSSRDLQDPEERLDRSEERRHRVHEVHRFW